MDEKCATAFGLMKIDEEGRIIEFAEKPKGEQLKAMKNCEIHHSVVGLRSCISEGAIIEDTILMGADYYEDIATRVIARELNVDETPVSKVMTRNTIFVLSDTLSVEALQKMLFACKVFPVTVIQNLFAGKFRHLPVVENGEVIALLDIAKCLYDAIARMERAAEKGKAIVAAVEGVERHWGNSVSGPNSFIETLRDRMFRPYLSTIIQENSKMVTVSPTDSVLSATQKMLELRLSAAVVTVENKPRGILTSKDLLMRVIAQNLSPESTLVEKVCSASC
ncbi:hypothetical protein GIB67_021240 [Kingdonia uniflora]|uniref:CBS domain-containing protein n=1 Tax=Kingdonia uniflora TaxID=39325 RepID=A0A7J7LFY5_9MAGN|nr:hypothetical protein GIB67_021240 [Kingdonia uniflora]